MTSLSVFYVWNVQERNIDRHQSEDRSRFAQPRLFLSIPESGFFTKSRVCPRPLKWKFLDFCLLLSVLQATYILASSWRTSCGPTYFVGGRVRTKGHCLRCWSSVNSGAGNSLMPSISGARGMSSTVGACDWKVSHSSSFPLATHLVQWMQLLHPPKSFSQCPPIHRPSLQRTQLAHVEQCSPLHDRSIKHCGGARVLCWYSSCSQVWNLPRNAMLPAIVVLKPRWSISSWTKGGGGGGAAALSSFHRACSSFTVLVISVNFFWRSVALIFRQRTLGGSLWVLKGQSSSSPCHKFWLLFLFSSVSHSFDCYVQSVPPVLNEHIPLGNVGTLPLWKRL